ncbi:RagB/SusD family nutrient uptake outer membrane protein [Marinilabilia sp.]|uniref:RagB/SusD family nutrient uptake outer membrane protein n=1 Tax=Marinilabilia sp. TaxID=2021252 RepID=UPI0025BE15B2|nr:RagB/SusD family nutrient uptake outer membrane protein [Marinilabilia sp.]
MKKIIYSIISLAFLFSVGCSDEMLDKQPLTEMSEEAVFGDPNLAESFVNARYNQIGHGWTESWMSSVCDETQLIWSRGCEPYTQGFVSPSNLGRMNGGWWGWDNRTWAIMWRNISDCNLFLEKVESVSFEDETFRNRLIGEVRFIRVLMYHDLISKWGAMPIIEKSFDLNDQDEIVSVQRNTYPECVDFMVSELDEASKLLPANYEASEKGRATSVAALSLKSRILLYAASPLMNKSGVDPLVGYTNPNPERWQIAADAAQEALDVALANGYGLFDKYESVKENYTKLFLEGGNAEIIFSRQGTSSADGESITYLDQSNGPNGYGQWGGNVPISEFVDCFEMSDGTSFDWDNPEHASNPYENRDQRLQAYVLCDGDPWMGRDVETWITLDANGNPSGGGLDTEFGRDAWNTSLTRYNVRKFMDESYSPNSWNFTPRNWVWLRLAEQYLNLAEALYMTGDEEGARNALNEIRERADMPDVEDAGEALLERIKNERRVELAFEEHRYFDVRRWLDAEVDLNKNATGVRIIKQEDGTKSYIPGRIVEERSFNAPAMYWMPIPKSEIDKNPDFSQNPGYGK